MKNDHLPAWKYNIRMDEIQSAQRDHILLITRKWIMHCYYYIDLIALVTDSMLDIGGEWNFQQSLGRCFLYFVLFVQEQLLHA